MDAAPPGPRKWEQQGPPSWQRRACSPEKVKVCADGDVICPFDSMAPENGSWVNF